MLQNARKQLQSIKGVPLLGLSGGPDSTCLCELLIELKKKFHIAHIDHNILDDSHKEKKRLEEFANSRGIPFHSYTLDSSVFEDRNLEDFLRNKRLKFFSEIIVKEKLDYLLLGHQKDERAETILKRIFEGTDLFNVPGIKLYNEYNGVKVIRPLIGVSKKEIIKFLDNKNIIYFTDPNNYTSANLRGRMRTSIIPSIEKKFGKNIISSLCDLGEQINDLYSFIEEEIFKISDSRIESEFGEYYPYMEDHNDYLYNLSIYGNLKRHGLSLSRDQKKILKKAIHMKDVGIHLEISTYRLYCEKSGIFLMNRSKKNQIFTISTKDIEWIDFWRKGHKNEGIKEIEEGEQYRLSNRKKISDFFRKKGVPLCLRPIFPIPLTTINENITIEGSL